MLRISSLSNEYYLGDKPGSLQYSKEPEEILGCLCIEDRQTLGFELCEHSLENLQRLTPNTKKGKQDWKILLIMKSERENGVIWLKAALQNRKTGKIALLTSTNSKENLNRPIKTLDSEWFVGHYRMSAPIVFWQELVNRLTYSV